jgi:hypothetical protein
MNTQTIAAILLAALRSSPSGLSRSEISTKLFRRNLRSADITAALEHLLERRDVRFSRVAPGKRGGRPREVWEANAPAGEGGEGVV